MLKRFIEQLTAELDMPMPEDPVTGAAYELVFDPNLPVKLFTNESGTLRLFTVLGPLPNEKADEFNEFMLTANLFGKETGGNFLGLDAEEKNITLTRFIEKEADYPEFRKGLEEFLNYSETWRADSKVFAGL